MSSHGRVTALLCVSWMLVGIGYYGVVFIIPQFLNSKYRLQKGLPPLPDDVEYVVTTATAVSEIVGYLLCGGLADQIGRRSMLTVSFGGSAAFALICGVIAHQRTPGAWEGVHGCRLRSEAFLAAAFMLMYTITPEIYPTTVRSTALGACSIFTRMGAAFTPFLAQYLLDSASALATYCTFSATMLVAAVCTHPATLRDAGLRCGCAGCAADQAATCERLVRLHPGRQDWRRLEHTSHSRNNNGDHTIGRPMRLSDAQRVLV